MKRQLKVTTPKSLARVPARCPQCDSCMVSWSPKRVWCVMCDFQTATRPGESYIHTIVRWNRAVLDGIGYYEMVRENNARQFKLYEHN